MRNFGKKWFISASSGVLGKILLVVFGLCVGVAGSRFISLPVDNNLIEKILTGILFLIIISVFPFFFFVMVYFSEILEWLSVKNQQENKGLELKNEKLKLELELLREKRQSLRDDEESS